MTSKNGKTRADAWLEQAYPQVHYMLLALEGQALALDWLKENSRGVGLLTRALTGRKKALAELHAEEPAELDDLFELLDSEDLCDWLKERQPEVHLLFKAIKDDGPALAELKKARPGRAKLALVVRETYAHHLQEVRDGKDLVGEAAADMACLTGEMLLKEGKYDKAIEAFTRAIEGRPSADLYEERARAYRGLAERDERRAVELRQTR
jgi:tetratricopeptide (TPR) repeat protein